MRVFCLLMSILLIVSGAALFLLPFFAWLRDPAMTQMEIFLDYWWALFAAVISFSVSGYIRQLVGR